MKKIKWILLILTIFLMIIFLLATCRKTNALVSELYDDSVVISSNSQSDVGVVFLVNMANNSNGSSSDFMLIGGASSVINLLNITNNTGANPNMLYICNYAGTILESYQLNSRILQIQIVEDTNDLYLIIYQISFILQHNQGNTPILDGVTRSMITRYNLGASVKSLYDSPNGLKIDLGWHGPNGNINWNPNFILNYSYIDYSETPQEINNWVDYQLLNYLTINNLVSSSYIYGTSDGYDDGYDDGLDEGEDIGYSNGYDEGYDIGYNAGTVHGYDEGYSTGYDTGYDEGWDAGQAGESAITPTFSILSGVFGVVASVFQIELVPHVPLGLFFLVPLFFSAIGLILWIWRRN